MLTKTKERLSKGEITRFVAIGSSCTESGTHVDACLNWFAWLDIFIRTRYDRINHSINTGIGGNTSDQVMARFDSDVLFYKPDVLFITIGGNDCMPAKNVSLIKYKENLKRMIAETRRVNPDCFIILQTYYAFDLEWLAWEGRSKLVERMPEYVQAMKDVATKENVYLVDNYSRWERFRLHDMDNYRKLMRDPLHLNPLGNLVLGLDLMRIFDAHIRDTLFIRCRDLMFEGLSYQKIMDKLDKEA